MTAPKLELVEAMELAGDYAQTAARSIRGTFAPRSHHASAIATALQLDVFGVDSAQDRFTIHHPRSTAKQIREARERCDWRTGISANLNALEQDDFISIVNALAEGRGPQESDRWRQAAQLHADALLAHIADLASAAISAA